MNIRLKEYQTYSLDKGGAIDNARLVYIVDNIGTTATADILRAVREAAAATIEAASRDTVELVTLPHANCCDVAVNYIPTARQKINKKTNRQAGDTYWSFSAAGKTQNVKIALSQREVVGDEQLVENVANMVGWNGKFGAASECSGVNVFFPGMSEQCRKTMLSASDTPALRATIESVYGKVNNATFHGWDAGEVLFMGASIGEPYFNDSGDELVDVTYQFQIQRNEASRLIGDIELSAVEGWDYKWGIYGLDPASGTQGVRLAASSRVYERADFSVLNLED